MNIAGLKSSTSRNTVKFGALRGIPGDIVCLQETHWDSNSNNHFTSQTKPHLFFWSEHCGFIIRNQELKPTNFRIYEEGRMVTLDINWNGMNLTIINVYVHNNATLRKNFLLTISNFKSDYPSPVKICPEGHKEFKTFISEQKVTDLAVWSKNWTATRMKKKRDIINSS